MEIKRSLSNGTYHDVVECGNMVYIAGKTSKEKGLEAQARDVIRIINERLELAGSDKNHILRATVFLKHISDFQAMNAIWKEWFDQEHAPVRATVEANMAHEDILIEIVVDAVKK